MNASAPVALTALLAHLAPGGYALDVVVEGPRQVPILGTLETRTESWSYVELVAEPLNTPTTTAATATTTAVAPAAAPMALRATETACAIESDGGMFVTRAAPALIMGLPPSSWLVQLSADGAVNADRGTYALGYRVPAGSSAPLPTRSDDPHVTDPDGDGAPGAAMIVDVWGFGSLHLQVASAYSSKLIGRARGDGAEGVVWAQAREEILSGLPVPGRLGPVEPREERSRFRLIALPAGQSGCAAVAALRRTSSSSSSMRAQRP